MASASGVPPRVICLCTRFLDPGYAAKNVTWPVLLLEHDDGTESYLDMPGMQEAGGPASTRQWQKLNMTIVLVASCPDALFLIDRAVSVDHGFVMHARAQLVQNGLFGEHCTRVSALTHVGAPRKYPVYLIDHESLEYGIPMPLDLVQPFCYTERSILVDYLHPALSDQGEPTCETHTGDCLFVVGDAPAVFNIYGTTRDYVMRLYNICTTEELGNPAECERIYARLLGAWVAQIQENNSVYDIMDSLQINTSRFAFVLSRVLLYAGIRAHSKASPDLIKQCRKFFFFDGPNGSLERHSIALRAMIDFAKHASVARLVFPWLNGALIDTGDLATWDVCFEAVRDIVAQFTPSDRAALGLDPQDPDCDARDPRFRYQRLAYEYYLNTLTDRTKQRAPPPDVRQDIAADWDGAEAVASVVPYRSEGYYAKLGVHGRGDVFREESFDSEPFCEDGARMAQWCLYQPYAMNEHSPIVAKPVNGQSTKIRVMAYHDARAMELIRDRLADAAIEFEDYREVLGARMRAGLKNITNPTTGEVTLSSGEKFVPSESQLDIVHHFHEHPLSVITGTAGTGKSTVIALLVAALNGHSQRITDSKIVAEAEADDNNEEGDTPRPRIKNAHDLRKFVSNRVREQASDDSDDDAEAERAGFYGLTPKEWLLVTDYVLIMAYGCVASNFTRKHGQHACTVNYLSAILSNNFWNDNRLVPSEFGLGQNVDIVFLDEFTVGSIFHLLMIIRACPRIKKFVFIGDANQMQNIERGNISEALLEVYGPREGYVTYLKHNYRLTNGKNDRMKLEERTHRAFDAVIHNTMRKDGSVLGDYVNTTKPGQLPSICILPGDWSPPVYQQALGRCPMLLLPHVDREKGADASLLATIKRLVECVGKRPEDWFNVQILTQRNEEVHRITECITRLLFPKIDQMMRTGNMRYFPTFDLAVGERVLFTRKVQAFNEKHGICFISKNDNTHVIRDIFDTELACPFAQFWEQQRRANRRKTAEARKPSFKGKAKRDTVRQRSMAKDNPKRARVVMFHDGYYLVLPYTKADDLKLINFMKRGICATNASMQGMAVTHVICYVRIGVSHTLTSKELYTSLSRMRERATIIASPEEFCSVANRPPPVKYNIFKEFLI